MIKAISERQKIVRVGIGLLLIEENRVLLGKRKGSHGNGTWQAIGGHLEFGETWEACARREAREEVGIEIKDISVIGTTNDIFQFENKHYITIFVRALRLSGVVKIMEPEKCEGWDWFYWDSLPNDLFLPIIHLKQQGISPF